MTINLLITPNVIINCLLNYEQEYQNTIHIDFLNKIISLSKEGKYSIFMTEIDLEVVFYHNEYFRDLLYKLNSKCFTDINSLNKKTRLIKILSAVKEYIKIAQEYPIDEDIFCLATHFNINNPSDAIRFAVAIAGEKLKKAISIDAIITWEPSHFCQETNNYFAIRTRGYGEVVATFINKEDNEIEAEISKSIYTPNHFLFSKYTDFNPLLENAVFYLIDIDIQSKINSQGHVSTNTVTVTIEYKNEPYSYTQSSDSGAISTLLLAIHICVKRRCLGSKNDFKIRKLLNKNLLETIIFSVSPVRGDNNEIHADIVISNQDIQATKRGSNLICSTGEAYIKILNHVVYRSIVTI